MKTTYQTIILGFGNHASIAIPETNLNELGGSKRSPLKVTINNYTYQSTATVMDGTCMVVCPMRDRKAAGVNSGDTVEVTLEIDSGYRKVDLPSELTEALQTHGLNEKFHALTYSKRKEFARVVAESKAPKTKLHHISKILRELEG